MLTGIHSASPILQDICKPAMKDRHYAAVELVAGVVAGGERQGRWLVRRSDHL